MTPFTEQVIQIIRGIPAGKVMTYGQVAALAGSPRGARQVVRILHSMSEKYALPWHRIVNAKGQIALQEEDAVLTQCMLLENDGLEIGPGNRISLEIYQYRLAEDAFDGYNRH
ncbi:MGMT family protein [Gorillibacterium massiliense]|uniref:MGMT family protein n=1 Tax=Gorillibacterium massiliense TaxID=1280390 RepID=UPI0004B1C94F|nr:MGMT family protein [Gorillibacterium massiliense]